MQELNLEMHLNLWFKWTSNQMITSCISSNSITSTCHVHASYCCICLCIDFRPRSFSIGPAPESVPEYLSEEQCPLLIYQASKPPCSFRYNPTLSLLLSVIALGQQRFNCYFMLRQLNPFLCMTCHCHSKQLKPTSMCRS